MRFITSHKKFSSIYLPLCFFALFILLTWPVWRWLWGEWWRNDYYSHGILIVPIALYLAWRRMSNDKQFDWSRMEGDSRGLLLLAGCLAVFLFFMTDKAYYLAALVMIGLLAGLLWTFGGSRLLRQLAFPLSFLTLMVPLPFLERATLPLALLTGVCSGSIVRWLGVDVSVTGSSVILPNTNLVIGAQCSGINSILALTALTALAAYALKGPLWGRLTLVLLAIPLAMLGNILRVANLLVVARYFGVEMAFTFYHDYSGFITFFLAFVLLIPLTKLLQCNTVRAEVL